MTSDQINELRQKLRTVGLTTEEYRGLREEELARREVIPASGFVYFIEAVGAGRVKIGHSYNVRSRQISFERHCPPFPLKLLATMPGTFDDEQALHKRFAHLRRHGEWFELSDELRNFIGSISGSGCHT